MIIELLEEITESGEMKHYILIREESPKTEYVDPRLKPYREMANRLEESIAQDSLFDPITIGKKIKPKDYGLRTRRPKLF